LLFFLLKIDMFRRNNLGANQQRNNLGAQPRPPQNRNEINYDSAIQTLKAMFTGVDESVLRLVLDTNGGRMETTVENLLQMTAGEKQRTNEVAASSGPAPAAVAAPNAVVRPGPAPVEQNHPAAFSSSAGPSAPLINSPYRAQEVLPTGLSRDQYLPPKAMSISPPPANRPRQISTAKHDLPADFLRPPSYWLGGSKNSVSMSVSEQEKEDAKLAAILQDSIFMSELQKHPEWVLDAQNGANTGANAAPSGVPNAVPKQPAQRNWNVGRSGSINQNRNVNSVNGQAEYTRSINDANNTRYDAFKSRMGDLGTAARSRLATLAERFKKSNNQQVSNSYQALGSDKHDEPPRPNQN